VRAGGGREYRHCQVAHESEHDGRYRSKRDTSPWLF
jgi:hypothetical protein